MLSRTADSLYWLSRYVERADNTARLLDAAYRLSSLPTTYGGQTNEWEAAVAATGTLDAFRESYGEATPENVTEFLAFSDLNPSSIRSCFDAARHNARSVRVALTSEMWEAINEAWLDMQKTKSSHFDLEHLPRFLGWVKNATLHFDGSASRTMLRNDGFWFSRLGFFIERADHTARILGEKHAILRADGVAAATGTGPEYYQWAAILRAVSALVSYRWIYRDALNPSRIVEFLILREEMPRSLIASCRGMARSLDRLAEAYGGQGPSQRASRAIHARLRNGRVEDIFREGLEGFADRFLRENGALSNAISEQYLF